MIKVNDLGSVGLVQDEFVVGQRLVQAELQDGEGDVVFLFGPLDLDSRRKSTASLSL